ncbi:universal stress protein [Alphaproteobacteria bacterium]|jgi:nucleotide-binding universal stress UspA family protein|nr:universal stress protein [Alphaproteobacteria bacterium]
MTMKTILVPIEEREGLDAILDTALLTAKVFGSYIEGLYYQPTAASAMVVAGEGLVVTTPELVESVEQQDRDRREQVHKHFEDFMTERNIPIGKPKLPQNKPRANWIEEESPNSEIVGSRSRVFDLTVVARPKKGTNIAAMSILEAALFEGGKPILIAPPHSPSKLDEHIAIAWNGSTETARTVAFSMPFINRAKKVTIITIEDFGVPGPTAQELARQLEQNGIEIETDYKHVDRSKESPGKVFLDEAKEIGADLLVKGAYTQSRIRQMIFGGATDYILWNSEIPVLMAN